jgi:four helix bundle protein
MANFRQLEVWQKAHHATLDIYRLTRSFPQDERFGLVSQMRRAAVSIGSNLAEGRGRYGDAEFGRFVQIALGSAYELQYQSLVAKDVAYISATDYDSLNGNLEEICRMLWALLDRTRASGAGKS